MPPCSVARDPFTAQVSPRTYRIASRHEIWVCKWQQIWRVSRVST